MPGKIFIYYFLELFSARPQTIALGMLALSTAAGGLVFAVAQRLFRNARVATLAMVLSLVFPAKVAFLPLPNAVGPLWALASFWLWLVYLDNRQAPVSLASGRQPVFDDVRGSAAVRPRRRVHRHDGPPAITTRAGTERSLVDRGGTNPRLPPGACRHAPGGGIRHRVGVPHHDESRDRLQRAHRTALRRLGDPEPEGIPSWRRPDPVAHRGPRR